MNANNFKIQKIQEETKLHGFCTLTIFKRLGEKLLAKSFETGDLVLLMHSAPKL